MLTNAPPMPITAPLDDGQRAPGNTYLLSHSCSLSPVSRLRDSFLKVLYNNPFSSEHHTDKLLVASGKLESYTHLEFLTASLAE